MGIWNTSANPIGYAYQSDKNTGIDLMLDPRSFIRAGSTRKSSSGGSSPNDDFKNKDILKGSHSKLEDLKNDIDSSINSLAPTYKQKILAEKNPSKVEDIKQEFIDKTNRLMQMRGSLNVANQDAKFEYDKWYKAQSEVEQQGIGSEIALANPLTGTIESGDQLLGMIASGRSPFQMKWKKDEKSGKLQGKLFTNREYLDDANDFSGIEPTADGRIRATTFNAPVTKMNDFMKTKNEITSKVDKAIANNIVTGSKGEIYDGTMVSDTRVSTNIASINKSIESSWSALSEGSRSYMLSNVLQGDINIGNNKNPKYISGTEAMVEVENLMNIARSEKVPKDKREEAVASAKVITDAIVNTAKYNVQKIAIGQATGLYNRSVDSSLMPNRNAAGDIIGAKKMSRIEQVEAGMTSAEPTPMFWRSPSSGKENLFVGRTNDKAKSLTTDEQNLYSAELLTQGEPTTGKFGLLSEQPIAIVNGVAVNPKVLFNNSNNKIVSIGSEIRSLPSYEMTPVKGKYMFNGQPTVFTNLNMIDLKKSYMDTYLKVTVKLDKDANVPDMKVNGVPTFIKYKDLTKQQKQQMGYSEDGTISMYVKSPSITSSGGNNTVSDYNLNVAESQAQMGDNIAFTKQLREYSIGKYNQKKSEDLKTLISNNPGAKYVTPDNKVIFGETEEEQIKSIQSTSNLDNRTEQEKYEMTKPILYRMRAANSITEEQYNKLLKKLEDKKPSEDRSKWTELQHINELPFDLYRSLNDAGNEIINQVIN